MNTDGEKERLSWTHPDSGEAWLALDRNGNSTIDNGAELFGNYTQQPRPTTVEPNGFRAFAEFDKVVNGGDNDGRITAKDAVFAQLGLWRDANQNGVSEPDELLTLAELGLQKLHLDYKISKKTDGFGNQFRWRAKVDGAKKTRFGRWAWDVFLRTQ